MTITSTDVANMALDHLHADYEISDLDTEDSTEANAARRWFDLCRQMVLKAGRWSFCKSQATLVEHDDDPPDYWAYRYDLPPGFLSARNIVNPLGEQKTPIPFEIALSTDGTKSLLTDEGEADLVFTKDVEDLDLFEPEAVVALSLLLAVYMAGGRTGRSKIKKECFDGYLQVVTDAARLDYNQQIERTPADAGWIVGREA